MDDLGRKLHLHNIEIVAVNEFRIENFRQIIGLEEEAQGVNWKMVFQPLLFYILSVDSKIFPKKQRNGYNYWLFLLMIFSWLIQ